MNSTESAAQSAAKKVTANLLYRSVLLVLTLFSSAMIGIGYFAFDAKVKSEVTTQISPVASDLKQSISIETGKIADQIKQATIDWKEQVAAQNRRFDEYVKASKYESDIATAEKIHQLEKQVADSRVSALENLSLELKKYSQDNRERIEGNNTKTLEALNDLRVSQVEILTEIKNLQKKPD